METALLQPNFLIVIATICILGGIALFMYSILKREHEIQDGQADTFRRYHKIINNAHSEARAIIDTTSIASTNILADSHATSEHVAENLDHVLQQIAQAHIEELKRTSDAFTKSYDAKLMSLQEELKNHTEQSIKDSETRLNQSLEKYLEPLATSATNSHKAIDDHTQELIRQVEKELSDYKAAQMAKVEAEVSDLVKKTYREVLRKSIPESLQEELVLESLEKAKTEGGIII
jgi:protein-tyrosine-phosphatase